MSELLKLSKAVKELAFLGPDVEIKLLPHKDGLIFEVSWSMGLNLMVYRHLVTDHFLVRYNGDAESLFDHLVSTIKEEIQRSPDLLLTEKDKT